MTKALSKTAIYKETNCVKCKKKSDGTYGMYIYEWEGRNGNACRPCGDEIHSIGHYLLDKAAELFRKHKIQMGAVKEKFGRFEIYAYAETKEQRKIVIETERFYRQAYPELNWDFNV